MLVSMRQTFPTPRSSESGKDFPESRHPAPCCKVGRARQWGEGRKSVFPGSWTPAGSAARPGD